MPQTANTQQTVTIRYTTRKQTRIARIVKRIASWMRRRKACLGTAHEEGQSDA